MLPFLHLVKKIDFQIELLQIKRVLESTNCNCNPSTSSPSLSYCL